MDGTPRKVLSQLRMTGSTKACKLVIGSRSFLIPCSSRGTPAPTITNEHPEALPAHSWHMHDVMDSTASKRIESGKWVSTILWAASEHDTWSSTWAFRASSATRKEPTPSNKPMHTTERCGKSRRICPRKSPLATCSPNNVRPSEAHSPPPDSEASLAVHSPEILAR